MEIKLNSIILKSFRTNLVKSFLVSSSIDEKFRLIRKYLKLIEEDRDSISNVVVEPEDEDNVERGNVHEMEKSMFMFLTNLSIAGDMKLFQDAPCAMAQAYLGIIYEIGALNEKKNIKKALTYYYSAMKMCNGLAIFRMGLCYEKGVGKSKNIQKALNHYRSAAKLGLVEALHIYGSILVHGDLGSQKDQGGGMFYLNLAVKRADDDYPHAYFDLARAYETDSYYTTLSTDNSYAFNLYMKGAKLGCSNSQFRIGKCYEFGELDKERNMYEAIYWYKKAAEGNQIDAQLAISTFYFLGNEIIDRSYDNAYYWALRAAIRGHNIAAYVVAEYIENGIGVDQDYVHSIWWYNIADVLGNPNASDKIREIRRKIKNNKYASEKQGCSLF